MQPYLFKDGDILPIPPATNLLPFCPYGLEDLLDAAQLVFHVDNFRKNDGMNISAYRFLLYIHCSC